MSASGNAAALDAVEVAQALIRCQSVTPAEGGALDYLQSLLEPLGFTCHRLKFSAAGTPDVDNLYARIGSGAPHIALAGHTDVVPPGDPADWRVDPFAGEILGDDLIGRGAVDMKGGVAALVAAASRVVAARGAAGLGGSISFVITGDEEGPAVNGTPKLLQWMTEHGEVPDACILGEPTSSQALGDTIKVGRRGSVSFELTVHGTQGHTAYPQYGDNPIHRLARIIGHLSSEALDRGTEHFEPSTLQVTSVDVGNPATNVIPAKATAKLNVRFNDTWSSDTVTEWVRERVEREASRYDLAANPSAESFLCPPGPLSEALANAVEQVVGRRPELGTGGGTSDARFIKDVCPVAEMGLRNATAHQVDERTPVAELRQLAEIYRAALDRLLTG